MSKFKIYTKTGDQGETSLVGGQRVSKATQRIDLYGEVDELNSCLGMLVSLIPTYKEIKRDLLFIQGQIFRLGSQLASTVDDREKFNLPSLDKSIIAFLEEKIDEMNDQLPQLRNFILPGGSLSSAQAHICRTVARRVERGIVHFKSMENDPVLDEALMFMNRLSDYIFILGRYLNQKDGGEENIWKV